MNKEKEPIFESGFSEKQQDLVVDRVLPNDQVKTGTIFDPKKAIKKTQNSDDLHR